MGRKSRARALVAWVNGRRAGEWRIAGRGDEQFQYDAAWLAAAEGRPLSLSLPFNLDNAPIRGAVVSNYFDNLLPDSEAIRRRIQSRFGTESRDAFDLLAAVGRDCAGAVQLLPPGDRPRNARTIRARPLSDSEVEASLIQTSSSAPLGQLADEGLRISLAGAQEKTAFLHHERRWCMPLGSTPTTHIFKLPLGLVGGRRADMTASVENEWLCSRIIHAYGLPIADCRIAQFGTQKALIVERFDRQLHASGKYWLRLVQEDFCQALGMPSSRKYEADGGPGLLEIAHVLRGSETRQADLEQLLKAQLLFWMLAASDAHAKNFSIRILSRGRYRLTPLYDVISYWPIAGDGASQVSRRALKLVMSVRGKSKHYRLKDVQRRHFNDMAYRMGVGAHAEPLIEGILQKTPAVVAAVAREVPKGFPQRVLDKILDGLSESAKQLAAMPSV